MWSKVTAEMMSAAEPQKTYAYWPALKAAAWSLLCLASRQRYAANKHLSILIRRETLHSCLALVIGNPVQFVHSRPDLLEFLLQASFHQNTARTAIPRDPNHHLLLWFLLILRSYSSCNWTKIVSLRPKQGRPCPHQLRLAQPVAMQQQY